MDHRYRNGLIYLAQIFGNLYWVGVVDLYRHQKRYRVNALGFASTEILVCLVTYHVNKKANFL